MVAWRQDDTPQLTETVIDFPTTSAQDWLAQGHEALTPKEAAKRLGVSETTLRRELFASPPIEEDGTIHIVAELRGRQFTAWRINDGGRVRWRIYLLGPKRTTNGHDAVVTHLRTQMGQKRRGVRRLWPFGR